MKRISPSNEYLEYSGRIDFKELESPLFIYPCSYVKIKFRGTKIYAVIKNRHSYWDNFLGILCDGIESKICIYDQKNPIADDMEQRIEVAGDLLAGEHEVVLFKRQDACHVYQFLGFEIEGEDAEICRLPQKPDRRIEVFGDSVSAGEVSEAIDFVGKKDPEWHQGEFSNSYYSYSWILARKLGAQLHDIAQGGIPLLNGTGWFSIQNGTKQYYLGMESMYDKLMYHAGLGEMTKWDFQKYRPHVVIVAIGQNDSNPKDYMKDDYHGEQAAFWIRKYQAFIRKLREIYPKAEIILTTTILEHDSNWDRAIEDAGKGLQDDRVHHFFYKDNGRGTPGHIRKPEAEQMAEELCGFIESLGEEIWKSEDER